MIELKRFESVHWLVLRRDTSQVTALHGLLREKSGIAYTAMDGDTILGCAGIVKMEKMGILWALFTDELRSKYPVWLHRVVKTYLMPAIQSLDLLRVEALVDPRQHTYCRWIEKFGFQRQELRKASGENGNDGYAYVLFPGKGNS